MKLNMTQPNVTMVQVILSVGLTLCVALVIAFAARMRRAMQRFDKISTAERVPTLVIFGSGGHTGEMISLIRGLDAAKHFPLYFLLAHSDATSRAKIEKSTKHHDNDIKWLTIHRSREVKQSLFTSIFSTLIALKDSFKVINETKPELILCNGPGTCVPICYVAALFRISGIYNPKIVFVESFCRVQSLSLSGQLLYPIVDGFVVHWPELAEKYSKAEYIGKLC